MDKWRGGLRSLINVEDRRVPEETETMKEGRTPTIENLNS
jgi:hypothetical protein